MKIKIQKKAAVFTAAAVMISFAAGFCVSHFLFPNDIKYDKIISLMDKYYLYDFDKDALKDGAYSGVVAALGDDYSYYYNEEAAADKKQSDAGKAVMLGIMLSRHPDTNALTVTYVHSNSPAKKAGIQKGDVITAINGESTDDLSVSDSAALIKKEEGAECTLDILRDNSKMTIECELFEFVEDSVRYRMLGSIGYIYISGFDQSTPEQFKTALEYVNGQNADSLIIDLRNDLGGLTAALKDTLQSIYPDSDIVRVKDKNGNISVSERTGSGDEYQNPIVALTNGYTASSAELFSLAVREHGGALIGDKTYGKGVVQTTYTLWDGSAVKLTTGLLVDKNGESYNKKGIEPDVSVPQSEKAQKYAAFLSDEDDTQLQAAISYLKDKKSAKK